MIPPIATPLPVAVVADSFLMIPLFVQFSTGHLPTLYPTIPPITTVLVTVPVREIKPLLVHPVTVPPTLRRPDIPPRAKCTALREAETSPPFTQFVIECDTSLYPVIPPTTNIRPSLALAVTKPSFVHLLTVTFVTHLPTTPATECHTLALLFLEAFSTLAKDKFLQSSIVASAPDTIPTTPAIQLSFSDPELLLRTEPSKETTALFVEFLIDPPFARRAETPPKREHPETAVDDTLPVLSQSLIVKADEPSPVTPPTKTIYPLSAVAQTSPLLSQLSTVVALFALPTIPPIQWRIPLEASPYSLIVAFSILPEFLQFVRVAFEAEAIPRIPPRLL